MGEYVRIFGEAQSFWCDNREALMPIKRTTSHGDAKASAGREEGLLPVKLAPAYQDILCRRESCLLHKVPWSEYCERHMEKPEVRREDLDPELQLHLRQADLYARYMLHRLWVRALSFIALIIAGTVVYFSHP